MIENLNSLFTYMYAHAYSQCLLDSRLSRWHCYSTQYTVRVKNKCLHKFLLCFINNHLITTT